MNTRTKASRATTPRVWVGCLSCYGNGRLVGEWVDAGEAADYVPCDRQDCDEWWVFDTDGLPVSGECSPVEATRVAGVLAEVEEYNGESVAFAAWCEEMYLTVSNDNVRAWEETHRGTWESVEDYAHDLAEINIPQDVDPFMLTYFNWDKWVRDVTDEAIIIPRPDGNVDIYGD